MKEPAIPVKFRATNQRKLIYSLVKVAKDHPDATMVYERARAADARISLGTVYRTLNMLHSEALIGSLKVGNSKRFDGDIEDHWHFVCRKCGTIYDFKMEELAGILNDLMKNMYEVEELKLEMRGVCHKCGGRGNKP